MKLRWFGVAVMVAALAVVGVTDPADARAPKPSCVAAFGYAEDAFTLAAQGLQASSDAMTASVRGDVAAIQASTRQLNDLTAQVQVVMPKYQQAKRTCLSRGTA